MPWLSRIDFGATDYLQADDLNNLGNDIRQWGGPVNGGGQTLSNVILQGVAIPGGLPDPTTTVGDLIVRGSTAPPTRLGVGSPGQVLTANPTAANGLGMNWATPAAGGGGGAVASVFGRTGAVVAQTGDYLVSQVTGAVPNTIQVLAGPGMTGGGNLSGNVTLSAIVTSVFGRGGAVTLTAADISGAGGVPATRQVLTPSGSGLSGGGSLTSDLSLSAAVVSVFGRTGAVALTSADLTGAGAVLTSRQILAGVGLTGGGNLSADRNLSVVADSTNQQVQALHGAVLIGTRHAINFTDTASATWTIADNPTSNRIDISVVATGGSGGGLADPTTTLGDLLVRGSSSVGRLGVGSDGFVLTADHTQPAGIKWAASTGSGAVTSVFTRTGAVVAAAGDYLASQVTNAVDVTQTYANPAWITSLAWSKITGAPAGGVASVFGRTGVVVAAGGDYSASQITNAVDSTQTYANPVWITSLAWSKITGAPTQAVASVFGRTGTVVAVAGDYTASMITNAVDSTQTYSNPAWISALAWSKITGAPSIVNTINSSANPNLSGAVTLAAGTNVTLSQTGQTITINSTATGGGGQNQTPWLSNIQAAGFSLLNAGGIGVGTASPAYPIDIQTSNGYPLRLLSSSAFSAVAVATTTTAAADCAVSFQCAGVEQALVEYDYTEDSVTVWVGGHGAAQAPLKVVGNAVGIIQSSPAYALDVYGDCNVTGSFRVNGVAISTGTSAVTSVFTRTGAVVAAAGDYASFYASLSGSYANPAWITSLPWSKITAPPAIVNTISPGTLSGAVILAGGANVSVTQSSQTITIAATGVVPATTQVIAGVGLSGGGALTANVTLSATPLGASGAGHSAGMAPDPGSTAGTTRFLREDATWQTTPAAPVSSVFTRTGAVVAAAADYSAFYVSLTGSYASPAWLTQINWSIITGIPATVVSPLTTKGDIHVFGTADMRLPIGTTANWVLMVDSTQTAGMKWAAMTPAIVGAVPTTTQVIAGTGLTGGGALSANVTLTAVALGASGASHAAGIAPDPGATAGTTRFLREDATWQAPPSAPVASVFGRTGAVVAVATDYTPAFIGAVPTTTQVVAGSGLSGGGALSANVTLTAVALGASGASHAAGIAPDPGATAGTTRFLREDATWQAPPSAPVTSVFTRTGAVVATAADYSAFYASLTGSYSDPAWITGLSYSKLLSVPAMVNTINSTGNPLLSGAVVLAAGSNVTLSQTAQTITISASVTGGGSQTPWTSDINAANFKLINTGNVGVGNDTTVLPDANTSDLHFIVGSSSVPGELTCASSAAGGTASIGVLNFANFAISATEKRVSAVLGALDGAVNSGILSFWTLQAGSISERMRITSAGLVGIGKTAPAYALDVVGDHNTTGVYRVNGVQIAAANVTNAVDSTQTYSNPAWITGLAWSKITGVPTIVNSISPGTLSGAVTLAGGANINVTQSAQTITVAATGLVPTTTTVTAGSGLSGGGALSANVTLTAVPLGASGASHAAGIAPDPGATAGTTRFLREDASWQTLIFRIPHTWGVIGDVTAITTLPSLFYPLAANQTAVLVGLRASIVSGTSVGVQVVRNGTNLGSVVTVTTTAATTTYSQALAANDQIALVLSAPVGTPTTLSVTLWFEHTL